MTTIKTTCPDCGDVMLGIGGLQLLLTPHETGGTYTYQCPLCGVDRARAAGPRVVMVLLAAGVDYAITQPGTITEADIAAFVDALDADTDLARLLGS
jgi:predicted RNA-binding Zn-ribbon protein involved in translation (DUF1610 family)